jgi:8-oxo-dGTP pyrophosphatase MutT (NUDIX family)
MGLIEPRRAATIVIVRNQNALLEILMLRRSANVVAAPGAHVFPGGGVDRIDAEVVRRGLVAGRDEADATRRLDLLEGALEYYCAALRELFEETGMLLVLDTHGDSPTLSGELLATWREQISRGSRTWPDLLDEEGLRLALGSLEYWAHWVTPQGRPRRFDTRFFIAAAPVQNVVVDASEIVEHVWTSATNALRHFDEGEWSMLVPTVRTLKELSAFSGVDEVLRTASIKTVTRIEPREVERAGRVVVVVPGESGYDDQDDITPQ